MKILYTILLLVISNIFMTFAWYGHLKMKQEFSWFASLPLIGVIAFSWAIAFFEYSCAFLLAFVITIDVNTTSGINKKHVSANL